MKTLRLVPSVFLALGFALLASGCATNSYSAVPIRQIQTYAIVAFDDQGVLSQAELDKIRDTLVQFLFDQGYVRIDQQLITDPVIADIVFRIKIAWPATGISIAILGVAPSYSGGSVYAAAPVTYAPPAPWVYDGWSYDPWWYGDYYGSYNGGYSYGPYCPFLTVFPFIPFYGFDHHRRPSPPYVHHLPPPAHRSHSWGGYSHYVPPWRPGGEARPPLLPPRRSHPPSWADRTSGPPRSPAATRGHSFPDHRTVVSTSLLPRPPIPYSDQRRASDYAMARPQFPSAHERSGPQNASAQRQRSWDSSHLRAPDSSASHPSSPASVDRPSRVWDTSARRQQTSVPDHRPSPDNSSRRADSTDRSPSSGNPQRQYAAPQHSSPPATRENPSPRRDYSPPARDSAASARSYSPPARESSAPARSYSPPPARESSPSPAHASSSSSSNSRGDSRSGSTDRER
jgi:hypothetical protein